jgi:uncharacterized membrane protein YgdD (TMEM256/DUF423 family)
MTRWVAALLAATLGFSGVACGAFGAHLLEGQLDARGQALWNTATLYALIHAAAALAVLAGLGAMRAGRVSALLLGAGAWVFSAALYGLAIGGPSWLGATAPLGGLLMLAGWVFAAVAALSLRAQGATAMQTRPPS